MNQPTSFRLSTVAAVLGVAATAVLTAVPALPVVQAVVSFEGAAPAAAGVRVVSAMPGLGMALVEGDALGLRALAAQPGVRGLAPDVAMEPTGAALPTGEGVLAATGLGGAAGKPGAGAGVRVAVLDTGVSDTAALNRASGRLVDGADSSGVVDGEPVRTSGVFDDGFGHGTFMASVIAGGPVAGTGEQALGVAPGAEVVVVKVADDEGTTSLARVLAGLAWIKDHAAEVDVVNISLSKRRPGNEYGADPLTDAVEQLRMAGVTVVAASGNHPSGVGGPGYDPTVLTVGALDTVRDRVAAFSGSDEVAGVMKPDVVASGVRVLGLLPEDSVLAGLRHTTRLDSGLYRGTGTSQAAAVVSGLAALVLDEHPTATPAQVKASLRCAATDLRGKRDGAGAARAATTLCADAEGQALDGSGDLTGEYGFDASSWAASSWATSRWAASSWGASSWAQRPPWAASSWAASSWAASSWAASSWAASSWAASSWAASSWAASSWAASSWAASDWGGGEGVGER